MDTRSGSSSSSIDGGHRATVAAGFVSGLLSGAKARGDDPRALLGAAGLPPESLHAPARTPIDAYAALYNHVVEHLGDEGFALFAQPLRPGTFEFLCRGVIGAPTVGVALDRAARFLDLVLPDLEVRVSREGSQARLEIVERRRLRTRTDDPRRVFAFEWLLRLLHGLACWLAARGIALDEVRFPYPRPEHAADYALVYSERASFDRRELVARFDATVLDLPVRRGESDLAAFLDGAPGKISMLYRRDRETSRRVREALAGALAESPNLDAIAHRLGVSGRTLHRRLGDEGTSFRAIREALRREEAIERLEKTDESIADIAAALGYSEPSAFFRSFVQWTQIAPSLYRKRSTVLAHA
jgi:AraC-like DNA-binding protein